MKVQKIALLMALVSSSVFADNNITLDKVTLFLQGAELQGQATVSLKKGESEIVLTGIADGIKPDSINVGFDVKSNVKILSVSLDEKYPKINENSSEINLLDQQLLQLQNKLNTTIIKLKAVNEQIELLEGNRLEKLTKIDNDDLAQLKKVMDFIKTNLVVALDEQYQLQQEIEQLTFQVTECQTKIDKQKQAQEALVSAVIVKVHAQNDITLPVTLSYITNKAGWKPVYDIQVKDIDSPLQLTYKADIYQNSGIDWQDINFSLSTSQPRESLKASELWSWHINTLSDEGGFFFSKSSYDEKSEKESRSRKPSDEDFPNELGVNTQFEVNLPYTIKTNNQSDLLTIQNKEVKAQYHYVATPKIDNSVYLEAQIVDWDKLNLLPGQSSIFFNGKYIGKSFINTKFAEETLDLYLGKDRNISISRYRDNSETLKPLATGDDISQRYAYTIDVKNGKSMPINLVVYDQIPVINNKTIKLDDIKYTGANYDKKTGLVTWNFDLNPNETKKLNLSFKVTYPKDKVNDIMGL
ncbi:DUF4139 domain-containing protein [Gilliamella apicola]|uniref:DUF4139 domain-containing protein n=1 Tax=Gilliamella apicola TaxID=1196095 RepID=UPI00080EB9C7|nr:mucoidy inhibitor MuiA family protein [Gilliamella apicola]OCG10030.1 hypothetical protein A9G14_00445 [Gilliamella apicola]